MNLRSLIEETKEHIVRTQRSLKRSLWRQKSGIEEV
jgi:hypothetical protein